MPESYIDHSWRKNICKIDPDEYINIVSKLDSSEYKVYCEAVQGYHSKDISEKLKITIKIVDQYLKSIYLKLNVESFKDLVNKYGNTYNYVNNIDEGF